jgi:hypothetical protein
MFLAGGQVGGQAVRLAGRQDLLASEFIIALPFISLYKVYSNNIKNIKNKKIKHSKNVKFCKIAQN